MAKSKDLAFSEGETWVINFALRDAAGLPLNLSGALVEWAVAPIVAGGASLLVDSSGAFVSISSATGGLGAVSIPPANHASVPAGDYRHELRATLADATVTVQIVGDLTVGDSVFGPDAASFGIFRTGSLQLTFDSATTDADPGNGEFRFNNAAPASAAFIYVDLLDRFGVDITNWLAALDDSTTTAARGHLRFAKASNEAIWHEFLITGAVVTETGYRKIPVSYINGAGSFTNGDIATVQFSRTGDTGATGATGSTGAVGADGVSSGIRWNFDTNTTTSADPGAGDLRLNNATLANVTEIGLSDNSGATGNPDVSAFLATWDDSTNTLKGHVLIAKSSATQNFALYSISAGTDATTHWRMTVNHIASSGSFSAADALSVQFIRAGDTGATGAAGSSGASALTVVRVASTANVAIATALENADVLNGVTLATNDLVLLTGQTAPAENGVYVVPASGAAARHASFDAYDELPGAYFSVMQGTAKADTLWRCTSDKGGTIGVTALAISEFTSGGGGPFAPQYITATGTFTKTVGATKALVKMVGGGGGGGGVATSGATASGAGGGGASGSYSEKFFSAIADIDGQTVTIGAAGAAGSTAGGAGGTGGATSIAALITAPGGLGGGGATGTSVHADGGVGGAAGTGSLAIAGNPGFAGNPDDPESWSVGGHGASSVYGGCGIGARTSNSAVAGAAAVVGYGAGGGGAAASNSATGVAGGLGTAGLVAVYEYA